MITPTEALILGLLAQKGVGMYGSGRLKRGSVYALLGRLEKSGYVEPSEDPAAEPGALPRTRYRITAEGARARCEFANWVGLALPRLTRSIA